MKCKFPIFLLPFLLGACNQMNLAPDGPRDADGPLVPVALTLDVAATEDGMPGAKADIYHEPEDPGYDAEAAIRTVLLLQFDGEDADAQLIGQQQYFDHWPLVAAQGEGFALVARSTPQTVVVIANSFGYLPLTDHTTLGNFLENENYKTIGSLDGVWSEVVTGEDKDYYLPMGGHEKLDSVTSETSMSLTLRRNCAKVVICVTNSAFDKTGDNKVIIEDVRMCCVNAKHYYVTDFSTADSADPFDFEDPFNNLDPMRFDAPEQTDASLNSGTPCIFTYYLPANLRGTGANTDAAASQKGKNLGAPLGATCFRIYAHYGASEKPIVYTYYLGGDLVNDFNLKPNTKYTYNITLSGKGTPANDYRINDVGDRTEFKVDANCYMLLPPDRADKTLTYTIPVRRAKVFWNTPATGGLYGAAGGDVEVLTLTESTEWKASFVWNKIKDADGAAVADSELLVGAAEESGKYVFSGEGFDPGESNPPVGHNPCFQIKVSHGMKGDALVAIKNADGIILWSWHLWVTDYNPDVVLTPVSGTYVYPVPNGALHRYPGTVWGAGQVYENAFIMDRNLGAIASIGTVDDTRGAYYQFGRKDPLYKSVSTTNSSSGELIPTGVHNPDKYFSNWNANDSHGLCNVTAFWGDPKLIDRIGHGGDNCEANKSIYDPCPPGWKVPVGGVGAASIWQGFNTTGYSEWLSSPAGRYFYPEGNPAKGRIWYPATGAWIVQSPTCGYWWSDTPVIHDEIRCYYLMYSNNSVDPSAVYPGGHNFRPRANAMPVRCVRLR